MAEESAQPACQLRRRRSSGNPSLPLSLEVGYQISEGGPSEGGPSQGTPSPSCIRFVGSTKEPVATSALIEFRKKQQSFDIQVEECEEEEIVIESDDEAVEGNEAAAVADRAVTPTPIQDFAANVVYTEGPQVMDFLKVNTIEQDCVTDVSDADSEAEE